MSERRSSNAHHAPLRSLRREQPLCRKRSPEQAMRSGTFSADFPKEHAVRPVDSERMDPIVLQTTTLSVSRESHSNLWQTRGGERHVVAVACIA